MINYKSFLAFLSWSINGQLNRKFSNYQSKTLNRFLRCLVSEECIYQLVHPIIVSILLPIDVPESLTEKPKKLKQFKIQKIKKNILIDQNKQIIAYVSPILYFMIYEFGDLPNGM